MDQAGITEPVVMTDKQFIIFLSNFYPELKKTKLDKIISGKRVQRTLWNIAPVTSTVKPSSASTVRPIIKDEPVDAKEIEADINPPNNFNDNVEEKLMDLLNDFSHIALELTPEQQWAAEQKKKLWG